MSKRVSIVIASISLVLLGACGPPVYHPMAQPPSTLQPPSGLEPPRDFTGLRLSVFPGKTTTTQANVDGKATLNGTVTANGAPVGGATVLAQRFVGSSSSQQTVVSGSDGSYKIENLVGGRYRLRAFKSPDMGMAAGLVFFLGNTETKTQNLDMGQFDGLSMSSAIAPDPPIFGQQATVAVRVTQRNVDGNGNITANGVSGISVTLTVGSPIDLGSAATEVTNGSGDATWTVTCGALGSALATFSIPGSPPLNAQLSACEVPPTTTTSTSIPATTSTTL